MPRRLAVVAGAGALSPELVAAAIEAGDAVRVLALSAADYPEGTDLVPADVGDPGAILAAVRAFGASHLALAGGVSLSDAARRRWMAALGGGGTGDVALSHAIAAIGRLTGAELVGAHQIIPELLAPVGRIAGPAVSPEQLAAARMALNAARRIGELDLGQAVVASGARLVAAEDVAGTDALLARMGSYRELGLVGGDGAVLLLAKARKPGQPMFIDLPAIGPSTVSNCVAAGITVIAVEAGQSLLLDRHRLREAADAAAISVLGIGADG